MAAITPDVDSRLWCIVPAAGIGKRMEADVPKQYLPLAGSTVLEHTLQRLLSINALAGVVIAIHPNDQHWSHLAFSEHPKIHTVVGGQERCDSVLAALDSLQECVAGNDWVLVHDAARPCVCIDNINHMVVQLSDDDIGGILAIPSSDTLKQVDKNHLIRNTLDRNTIWQAQTPQMFRYGLLREALVMAADSQVQVTDEASAIENMGYCGKVVLGRKDNIKITHPDDLGLAEMIIERQAIQ